MNLFHIFISYFSSGGLLMIPIFFVSIVAWYLGIEKIIYLRKFKQARKKYLRSLDTILKKNKVAQTTGIDAFDHLLEQVTDSKQHTKKKTNLEVTFKEFLIHIVPEIEKGFSTMSAWISVAPLLGLLGTVTGMIKTFQVITDFGLGNPNLTAEGISIALITTQAGLTVAFPMVIFHNYLYNRSQTCIAKLMGDGEALIKDYNRFQY